MASTAVAIAAPSSVVNDADTQVSSSIVHAGGCYAQRNSRDKAADKYRIAAGHLIEFIAFQFADSSFSLVFMDLSPSQMRESFRFGLAR